MINAAPVGFDVDEFYRDVMLFQRWEIFPDCIAKGAKDVLQHMQHLRMPARLDGLRVLDIAPWNGFFSFECARRGAAEVVSFGPDDPDATGYSQTKDLLGADVCHYIRGSVYDLSPERNGSFDIVLFLGLIYHLRHPLLALDRIYDVAKDRIYVDSPTIDENVYDRTLSEEQRVAILEQGRVVHDLPMTYFTKGEESGDAYNWFLPNRKALVAFVEASGFAVDHSFVDPHGWMSLSATKGARSFAPGLEGWNEAASQRRGGR